MATVRAGGIDLYYETRGEGEPLLLLAGFACDHTYWEPVAALLETRFTLVCPDNRGSGRTGSPEGAYSARRMADDAVAVLDELGIDRTHVAGHSLGGEIAQELALAHPRRIRSLALLSTSAKSSRRLKEVVQTAAEMVRHAPAELCCRSFLPWMFTEAFFETPGRLEAALARMLSNPHPPAPAGLFGQSAAVAAFDAEERIGGLRVPALVAVGAADALTPPERAADLARRIPGAELAVLPGGAHDLVNEIPEALVAAMLRFLSKS